MEDALTVPLALPSAAPADSLSLLAARARSGDRAALDDLLRGCADDLLRVCTRLTGERQDGLDALQEAFVRIAKAIARYDARRPARPWLVKIAVRSAQDRRRSRGRRSARFTSVDPATAELADHRPGPEAQAGGAQLAKTLQTALDGLPPQERDAFVLRELEQLDTHDVARILGCRPVTVRGHSLQARRKLGAWMKRHHPELVPEDAR